MDDNYIHERQETSTNQESTQGQPHIQPPLHYHQQYPPPAHHAIQTGYHGLRFASDINSMQTSVSDAGTAPGQVPIPTGVHPPRLPITSGSTSITNRESHGQKGHFYDHVLGLAAAMQVNSAPLHYRPDLSSGAIQLQQVPTSLPATVATPPPLQPAPTLNSSHDPSYLIEDLSNSTHSNVSAPHSVHATLSCPNPSGNTVNTVPPTTLSDKKKKSPKPRAKRASLPQPVVQFQPQRVQNVTKCCQTEPMFEDIWKLESTRAEPSSLPSSLEFIQAAGEESKIVGVNSTKDLEEGETFGPYTGEFVKEGLGCYNPSTWEVCVRGRVWFYLDGSTDPDNWMHHVQYARSSKEQNMEAFQSYGDIYFRITKPIKSGTELRVFYSPEYRKRVGFKTSLDELHVDQDNKMFQCQDCKHRYNNPKSLMRHLKFEHDKENQRSTNNSKVDFQSENSTPTKLEFITSLLTKRAKTTTGAAEKAVPKGTPKKNAKEEKGKKYMQVKFVPLKNSDDNEAKGSRKRKRRFTCKRCGKLFSSGGRLRQHERFHEEAKDTKPVCKICGLECKHQRALKQHMPSHDSSSFQCPNCDRFFNQKNLFAYHLRRVHKIYIMPDKGRRMEKFERYVGPEEESEEPEEPFHPDLPKDMLGKQILITSKNPKVFKCKYCPKRFSTNKNVIRHEDTVHTNNGQYKCEYCPATYTRMAALLLHRQKHTMDRPFKCEECPRSFSSESALKNHLPEHRGERPYICDVCGKGFGTRKNMTCHKRRVHMAPTTVFNCSFCEKTFKHKTALSQHEQRHKGIRPHVCLTCGRAFGTKFTLQSHMRIHTGEKPFECRVCHQKFALNHHLARHMTRHQKALAGSSEEDLV
ncbi:histone-lysine N-methyltransferase PRDM9-like isoform X2 [Lytechinus variegatus]|nr:histone-lysine N-methyltransferase PRDM9-like isoform X2 [Lytechinus variegatus]XP_041470637.1 histone-lysine N-methyltransferase PRDM9-like isoform X2 [Lytechinus variegatus]XP_041470638.1 histone-lysine N-methyltransferase PRDM9-like isoform X2 [Lytechinus variegatus]